MAVPTNTYSRYGAIGVREDLADVIYDISPTETPIMSSIGKARATQTNHEWQTDVLAAATFGNALIEGDDATSASLSPTVRIGNFCQIVGKTVQISGTLEAVDKAGRKSEKAYQLAKASSEIKRDIENIITANQAKSNGTINTSAQDGFASVVHHDQCLQRFGWYEPRWRWYGCPWRYHDPHLP